jgi:hypothetical protein
MLVAAASLARTSTPPIEASEVAQALQQGGIPFAGPIASGGPIEGSLSSASTTTDGATVAVLVFDSNGARYDARQKEVDGCPSCSYAAQCGALLVSFTPKQMPDDAAAARARTAYQILKSRYACE